MSFYSLLLSSVHHFGFLNDSPLSSIIGDAKLPETGAGTSEIRRMLCGRELMRVTG